MSLMKSKPTSPGRRFRVKISNPELHKGKPCESLLQKSKKSGGRNDTGKMTIENIRVKSQVLKELEDAGEIQIIGGMYDIKTGAVEIY